MDALCKECPICGRRMRLKREYSEINKASIYEGSIAVEPRLIESACRDHRYRTIHEYWKCPNCNFCRPK